VVTHPRALEGYERLRGELCEFGYLGELFGNMGEFFGYVGEFSGQGAGNPPGQGA
jgi:hypothetical protein